MPYPPFWPGHSFPLSVHRFTRKHLSHSHLWLGQSLSMKLRTISQALVLGWMRVLEEVEPLVSSKHMIDVLGNDAELLFRPDVVGR